MGDRPAPSTLSLPSHTALHTGPGERPAGGWDDLHAPADGLHEVYITKKDLRDPQRA